MRISYLLLTLTLSAVIFADFTVNDDQLYTINWDSESLQNEKVEQEQVVLKTDNNETYSCLLPTHANSKNFHVSSLALDVNNETALLDEFFQAAPCIYKVDGYWTYELCHNNHIRQFRAEVTAPQTTFILKEYYLGYKSKSTPMDTDMGKLHETPKSIRLNGKNLPYYAVAYDEGTDCDLTGAPRSASVLYVCVEESHGELFQVSEVETCVYQVIVFTKHLCKSPLYGAKQVFSNFISCQPHDENTHTKPSALLKFEKEMATTDHSHTLDGFFGNLHVKGLRVDRMERDGSIFYRVRTIDNEQQPESITPPTELEFPEPEEEPAMSPSAAIQPTSTTTPQQIQAPSLQNARAIEIQRFLRGEMCLMGGVGWWRHEVCYGTKITQYHEDEETQERSEITLGVWDAKVHLNWLKENPTKKPLANSDKRKKVSLFYGQGDFCKDVEAQRSVILTLNCQPTVQAAVQLSFSEPSTCEYSISLKSALFCDIVKQADENGLLSSNL